jgi:hypothetical protein
MEAMTGILCIDILVSASKNAFSFLLLLMYSPQQIGEKGRTGSAWKRGRVGVRRGREAGEWPKQCMHI